MPMAENKEHIFLKDLKSDIPYSQSPIIVTPSIPERNRKKHSDLV